MSISFSGLASGLDTSSWVKSLTALKQAKVTVLEEEKKTAVLSKETLNGIKSFFNSFRSVLEKVTDTRFNIPQMDLFAKNVALSSKASVVSATANSKAQEGKYKVNVDKLASNTEAVSKYKHKTTYQQTTVAENSTLLKDLGIKSGNFAINVDGRDRVVTIEDNDTISVLTKKLNDVGVKASYNSQAGIFSMNIGADKIDDFDNTGIVQGLHLSSANPGYSSNSLISSKLETIHVTADGSTKLSALGVKGGDITVEFEGSEYVVTLEDGDTIQDLIDVLKGEGIDASIDSEGIFSINNAKITDDGTTNLLDALGLKTSISSSSQTSGVLQIPAGELSTVMITATSATKLSDLIEDWGNVDPMVEIRNKTGEYIGRFDLEDNATIGDLLNELSKQGINGTIEDGVITLNSPTGNFARCEVLGLLGIIPSEYAPQQITQSSGKLTLKSSATNNIIIGDVLDKIAPIIIDDGTNTTELNIDYNNTTFGELFEKLKEYGVEASINDGVITFRSEVGAEVTWESLGALNTNRVVFVTMSPSNTLTYQTVQGTPTITRDTLLSDLGTGDSLILKTDQTYTINFSETSTVGDLIDRINSYGGNASIDNNRISISDCEFIGGDYDVVQALGLNKSEIFNTKLATLSTKLSELGVTDFSYTFRFEVLSTQTITLNSDATIENLLNSLNENGIHATFSEEGNYIEISSGIDHFSAKTGDIVDVLGLKPALVKNVFAPVTSTAPVTYQTTVYADRNTKLSDLGVTNFEQHCACSAITFNTIKQAIIDNYSTINVKITNNTRLNDIGDSIDRVQLITALEEEYDIDLSCFDNQEDVTVFDLHKKILNAPSYRASLRLESTFTLSNDATIGDWFDKLEEVGIFGTISNGEIVFERGLSGFFPILSRVGSGKVNISDKLGCGYVDNRKTMYVQTSTAGVTYISAGEVTTLNASTTWDDLGWYGQVNLDYTLPNSNKHVNYVAESTDTVLKTLSKIDCQASIDFRGKLTLKLDEGASLDMGGAEHLFCFGNVTKESVYVDTDFEISALDPLETTTVSLNANTTFADLGLDDFILKVKQDQCVSTYVKISTDDKVLEKLNSISGITASITDGKISLQFEAGYDYSAGDLWNKLNVSMSRTLEVIYGKSNKLTVQEQHLSYVGDIPQEAPETLPEDVKLADLGITSGSYDIYSNGVKYTANISDGDTLGDLKNTLESFGLQTEFIESSEGIQFVIKGDGKSYIQNGTSNVADILFGSSHNEVYNYTGTLGYDETTTIGDFITESTLVSNFDTDLLKSAGVLTFTIDGEEKSISISSDETFGSLIGKLNSIGLEASISEGKFLIGAGANEFSIDNAKTTSNILSNLGLVYSDDLGGYLMSSQAVEFTETITEESTLSVANYADYNTKLSLLNISDGTFSLYRDGQKANIQINSDETFGDLRSKIAAAFSDIDIAFNNGKLEIFSKTDGVEVKAGATTDTSNFAAICGFSFIDNKVVSSRELYKVNGNSSITGSGLFRKGDVTEGTFTIGNATFTIDSNTTLNNIISMINSSDEANATAYWDTINGEFVIKSKVSGSSLINIEAGTSNFTEVMGYTSKTDGKNTLEIDTQNLGSNAYFSINGTKFTSTSNTITSDISRIEGLTLELKQEGEEVEITVEKDKESVADAVGDIVDSYNELITNVDKEIANDGKLHDQTTLKLIRNQIRNMMTSSLSGNSVFRNLDSVGISLDAAKANNIETGSINLLHFDRDKFIQAFEQDRDSLKDFLVGDENSLGVFSRVENVVEQAVASVSGYFSSAERSYNTKVSKLDTKIKRQNAYVERYKTQLESKFKYMDMIISKMQNQYSSFLAA